MSQARSQPITKQDWRLYFKKHRHNQDAVGLSATAIEAVLGLIRGNKQACSIGLYRAFGAEIDLGPLNEKLLRVPSLETCFPAMLNETEMIFQAINSQTTFVKGVFGFEEPNIRTPHFTMPDIIFVPGLGFDEKGTRLGRGKGHYDRYFATLSAKGHSLIAIGVVEEKSIVKALPAEDHDYKMDFLLTEKRLIEI